MKNFFLFALALTALASFIGCGPSVPVPLEGKVVYSDDKSPLPYGTIIFESDKVIARGTIQPDGTFVVNTSKEISGLLSGEYAVYFAAKPGEVTENGRMIGAKEPPIAKKYYRKATSGLTLKVGSDTKRFDVSVDRQK